MQVQEEIPRFDVLGSRISALTLDRTVGLISDRVAKRTPGYVCICNVNDVVEGIKSPEVKATINEAWLATPDGMPMVWWGRRVGFSGMERVYGPDLLRTVIVDPRRRRGAREGPGRDDEGAGVPRGSAPNAFEPGKKGRNDDQSRRDTRN